MEFDILKYEKAFRQIYGHDEAELEKQFSRYTELYKNFSESFGEADIHLFSTPGRTELGGNHTDHNNGRVLAASVDLDSISIASDNDENKIVIYSRGYEEPFEIGLDQLEVMESEKGTTSALIRGIAFRFKELGYSIGGFNAFIESRVLPGSGLSSSASIEVLISTILNAFYNDGNISPEDIAKIGQYAENVYFGKPCGLMDQVACAVGGIISIDFKDSGNPLISKIDFDFTSTNHSLLIVNTGGSHADLTDDYALIPSEMKDIAGFFKVETVRNISTKQIFDNMLALRKRLGDRPVLRALHFLQENERVGEQVKALEHADFVHFLELVKDSGNSSFKWLQNIYSPINVREQGITLALALTETFLNGISAGACRVHGGGFAGTIQVYLPNDSVPEYVESMEKIFGENSVFVLSLRSVGSVKIC